MGFLKNFSPFGPAFWLAIAHIYIYKTKSFIIWILAKVPGVARGIFFILKKNLDL